MFRNFNDFNRYLIGLFLSISATTSYATPNELTFLNWSEYMDPEVIQAFEKEYNAKIKFVYFETDETRDNLMVQTDGKGYDLIMSNGPAIHKYFKRGWIHPVTEKDVPNLKHIDKKWIRLFTNAEGYSVPFTWGTTGIAYRKDLVGKNINSWKDLFQPAEAQHGKIAMVNSSLETISLALKMLDYSANSESTKEIRQAEAILKAQKPYVRNYSYISLEKESSLLSGDVHMAIAYSGDALILKESNDNIEYSLPKEGGMIWIDSILVSKFTKNKQLAYNFLNYINRPTVAKKLIEFAYCATPNKAAEKLLDDEFLNDPVIYPSAAALEKSEIYGELKPRNSRLRNQIFSNIIK